MGTGLRSAHRIRGIRFLCITLLSAGLLSAQVQVRGSGFGGAVRMIPTDAAVLEMQEARKDLPCSVTPTKPFLGFDLRFHGGYEVSIPLKELSGNEDLLTILFRVTPDAHKDEPVYLMQKISVPAIEPDARGDAYLQGGFDLGEGRYHVDWLIRDRTERVCSFYWEADAELPAKDKTLALVLPPSTVQASEREAFKEEPPIDRATHVEGEVPLNVKVLINFAPQNARSATLQPLDLNALVSILRSIAREPKIARFSIVAFNMQEQRVIYRQDNSEHIDFPALGDALESIKLGTVDFRKLAAKNSETDFLAKLITGEMNAKDRPDALIFAGPKVMLDSNVPEEALRQVGPPAYPVFYMNYTFNPQANPWRDAIGNTVKYFKGYEYTISRPRDLWNAWTEIMSRIVKFKVGRRGSETSAQE
jgi:hypothetical protein